MARWQPPIPSGALWSPDALKLGSALALLGFVYDLVQVDGTFRINLHEVAGAMADDAGNAVPYPTIKRWWAALRDGPFFASVKDEGRRGLYVRMSEEWIDRRILDKRVQETGSKTIPNDDTPTPVSVSEMIPNTENEPETGRNRDRNGTETGSYLIAPYIGTHDDQVDMTRSGAQAPKPASKKRALKEPKATQEELADTPMAIYRNVTNVRSPNQAQRELIETTVTDTDAWRTVCEQFAVKGWNVRNVANLLDAYQKRVKEKARLNGTYVNGTNGIHPTGPPPVDYSEIPSPYANRPKRQRKDAP